MHHLRPLLCSALILAGSAATAADPTAPATFTTIPTPAGNSPPPTFATGRYILPVTGTWFVSQGGDTPNVNQHVESGVRPQSHALDLIAVGAPENRAPTHGDPAVLANWYGFGQPVIAPAEGDIIECANDQPDNPIGTKDLANPAGNFAAIRVTDDEVVLIAHLQHHSLKAHKGDHVAIGSPLGLRGNSGNTTNPHVHIHVQDTGIQHTEGKDIIFHDLSVGIDGVWLKNPPFPLLRGMFIQSTATTKKP